MAFSRRKFLRYTLAGCVGLGGYVWRIEPEWIVYEQRELSIPGLPQTLHGKKLIQISDLHIGHQVADAYLLRQFDYVKLLKPDFVVYTGDFVDEADKVHFAKLDRLAPKMPLGQLGTAGVLGNHDYDRNTTDVKFAKRVQMRLVDAGISVLSDESIEFHGLAFAGLEDYWSPKFSQTRSAELIKSLKTPSIALSHNPDTADLPMWAGFNSWILCGHTHGGQCRVPGLTPPLLPVSNRNYVAGAYDIAGGHRMYINRGVGHTLRVRFCARPEITVFTLKNDS